MALNSKEKLMPDRLDWNMKWELPPLAKPGKTRFL
jgi:hypothetical protein